MALVLSPLFGRTRFSLGRPLCFTDLVVLRVPKSQSCAPAPRATTSTTRVEWMETQSANIFKIGMPGLKKEDVKIQIEDDRTLYISAGNRKENVKESEATTSQEERPSGSKFLRKFKLPENSDLEQIKAVVENGLLTVTVPKRATKAPETRKIEVSGGESTTSQDPILDPQNGDSHASEQPSISTAHETSAAQN